MEYRGFVLDRFQEEAIGHLMNDRSVLVAAPTGTGKTVIADWIVDEALAAGKRVIYTAPIKALSNQKYRDYCRLHGEENTGLVTGDLVIRRQAPCLVMTTEILRNMLLSGESMADLRAVVVDEIHFLDDRERGTVWEEILIYLPQHVLIVALSATLPNLESFAAWLSHVRQRPVEVVLETKRAVPLDWWFATQAKGIVTTEEFERHVREHSARAVTDKRDRRAEKRDGRGDGRTGGGRRDDHKVRTSPVEVVRMVERKDWLPLLYFVFSRADAERFAGATVRRFGATLVTRSQRAELEHRIREAAPTLGPALDDQLREMYLSGVAFHHAGVHVHLKAFVEELYESRLLSVLFCTSTFALGINMPARTVSFHSLMKFDGQEVRPLTTRGFMQKAGRAGRRGMDEAGHVVMRMDPDDYEDLKPVIQRYRKGFYEPVRSSFNLSFNSIVHLIQRHGLAAVRRIVDKSFLSWHLVQTSSEAVARAVELETGEDGEKPSKGALKEAKKLRSRAEKAHSQCWDQFMERRDFLQRIGYLAEDDSFNAGARILQHIQIAEVFVTELVLSGELEDLDGPTLYGIMCAVSGDLPRGSQPNFSPTRQDRELVTRFNQIRMSAPVTGSEALLGQPVTWSPEMMVLGRCWAEGMPLEEILMMVRSPTDISGTLVSAFRRAKDLAGQLKQAYIQIPERMTLLGDIMKKVARDEVEVVD